MMALEAVAGAGMPCKRYEVQSKSTFLWTKLHDGLCNKIIGAFKGREEPAGDNKHETTKNKTMNHAIPMLAAVHDDQIDLGLVPLPSFLVAKNTNSDCRKTLKKHQDEKDNNEKGKKSLHNR